MFYGYCPPLFSSNLFFFFFHFYSSYLSDPYTLFHRFSSIFESSTIAWTIANTGINTQWLTALCEALVAVRCCKENWNTETISQRCWFTLTAMCKEEPRESWGALGVCGRTATLNTWLSKVVCGPAELDTWEGNITWMDIWQRTPLHF